VPKTFDAEAEIAKISIWQAPCGCWKSQKPGRKPWFYKPVWGFYRWTPFWLGGDEFCRRTLVVGWDFTGQIVIPLWYCRTTDPTFETCGCGPDNFDGPDTDATRVALDLHKKASLVLHSETIEQYREWQKHDPLDDL
jgi:hypothetical protein